MHSYRRYTVLAIVFASLGKCQPLFALQRYRSEDATFPLRRRRLRQRVGWLGMTKVLYAAPVLPCLDSFSFELVSLQVRTRVVGVYPLSPKPPALVDLAAAGVVVLLLLLRPLHCCSYCDWSVNSGIVRYLSAQGTTAGISAVSSLVLQGNLEWYSYPSSLSFSTRRVGCCGSG